MLSETEFILVLSLTIAVIIVKFSMATILGLRVMKESKENGKWRFTFIAAVFFFVMGLAISRTLYLYFDFFLTKFEPELFYIIPNVRIWQTATFISGITAAGVLYFIEKNIYQKKFYFIPTIIALTISCIQFFYQINSSEKFNFISSLGIIANICFIIVPIAFLYLGTKSTGILRKVSLTIGIVVVIYAIIGMLMSEQLLASIDALIPGGRIFIIILVPITKMILLSILTWAALNFQSNTHS